MLSTSEVHKRLRDAANPASSGIVMVPCPFSNDTNQIGRTSIDFRLGRWFTLIQQTKSSEIDFSQARSENRFAAYNGRSNYVPFGQKFVLHPNRFVLATTFEWLSLPGDIAAYISGKSSLGRMGLIIETAAGIHPGFSGCITLELFNCGEVPIAIFPGMKICQVFFHEVVGSEVVKETHFGGRRKPAFGNYAPDGKLAAMLKGSGDGKLF